MQTNLRDISPEAKIGKNVEISNFTTICENVEIGDNTWIGPYVTIFPGARIGKNCKIFPGAVIAAVPQDLKFEGEDTLAIIGDDNIIREYVTINRGTKASGVTRVGNGNLIMAYVHIAHDCVVGNHCILSNNTTLAGHITMGDYAIMGGKTAILQFVHIGAHVITAGGSLVDKDIPPFVIAGREPVAFAGLNIIGLRRRGFSREMIDNIAHAYRLIYQCNLTVNEAMAAIKAEVPMSKEIEYIIDFVSNSQRGIIR